MRASPTKQVDVEVLQIELREKAGELVHRTELARDIEMLDGLLSSRRPLDTYTLSDATMIHRG